jgi:preprotein translocase subunit SecB
MADEADTIQTSAGNGADTSPQIALISQYVKDLSFENPNSPAVYQWPDQPHIDVQFNIGADKVGDEVVEVSLKIEVKATAPQGTAFAVELLYAALFGMAEAPRLIFPFARRVLADAIRDGGFPPLLLDPIDFGGLYEQQAQAMVQTAGEPAGHA